MELQRLLSKKNKVGRGVKPSSHLKNITKMNSLEFLLIGIWVGMGFGYLITKDFYKKNK